nr:hypothetical protein [Caldimonas sp.]
MHVEPRRHEDELRPQPARDEPLDRADRGGVARSRAGALVRRGGRAVDRDLDAVDGELGEAVGAAVVDAAAVGLELDRDAIAGEALEDAPRVRDAERLTAAEGDVGDVERGDRVGEGERLARRQLVAPRLVGAGFLAACEAARSAAVGQLPGEKKGRRVLVDGAPPRVRSRVQVKRMYGCAITCSETSSSLGVSQTGF